LVNWSQVLGFGLGKLVRKSEHGAGRCLVWINYSKVQRNSRSVLVGVNHSKVQWKRQEEVWFVVNESKVQSKRPEFGLGKLF